MLLHVFIEIKRLDFDSSYQLLFLQKILDSSFDSGNSRKLEISDNTFLVPFGILDSIVRESWNSVVEDLSSIM